MTNWGGFMEIKILFGKALKEIRSEKGISQEKCALQIDMDRTYYASVEAGRRNISLENILKISDGYQIPISEIFLRMENLSLGEDYE